MIHQTSVEILVKNKPIKKYAYLGEVYVEAKCGAEYSIKIRNNTYNRRLYLVSVDGINVIDGQAAGNSNAGYIINGYNSLDIKGFRISEEKVRAFEFNYKDNSYASCSPTTNGDTSNCGIIGVKVFDEKIDYPSLTNNISLFKTKNITEMINNHLHYPREAVKYLTYSTNNTSSSAYSSLRSCITQPDTFDMGTAFSDEEIKDEVRYAQFNIGYLSETVLIKYASKNCLERIGVPIHKVSEISEPDAFPKRFCPIPK